MTAKDIEDVKRLRTELSIIEAILNRNVKEDEIDRVAKAFHLGMVGGSGRNVRKLNKMKEKSLDRTIAKAKQDCELFKQKEMLERKIIFIESGERQKSFERKASRVERLIHFFKNLKPGDTFQPGNSPLTVIKVNSKSIITEGGTKWSAAEVIGTEAAQLL